MTISVVTIAKNIISQGYCFWESLRSCLPLMDELVISEGFSDDKTLYYLEKFKEKYCNNFPVILYQEKWPEKSYHGEAITEVSMSAINKATKEWILYLQLDEIYHELTIDYIKKIVKEPYNAISFPFYHFLGQLQPSNRGYKEAIRTVRRSKNVKLKGDAWTFENCEPICPSNLCPKPIYHFGSIFPKQNITKDIEHAKLYTNIPEYNEKMKKALSNKNTEPYPLTNFNDFPKLAKRFIGLSEYTLP